jgi:hypothetical protein
MAKKPTGLGRGLDELLDDNLPTKKIGAQPLVVSKGEATESKTESAKNVNSTIYQAKTRSLYETKPRTNSVKSNFKNIK